MHLPPSSTYIIGANYPFAPAFNYYSLSDNGGAFNSNNITNNTDCFPVKDGYHYIPWMLNALGECIRTPTEQASFWIGLSSIGFWLFANLPQIIENYRKSNADSLAPAFLFQWILGDSLNLIGSILANQLPTQIATAVYYVCMDVILIAQFIYYTIKNRRKKQREELTGINESDHLIQDDSKQKSYGKIMAFSAFFLTAGFYLMQSQMSSEGVMNSSFSTGRKLLSESQQDIEDGKYWPIYGVDIAGYVIGSLSTCLYLGSRIPQIIKNFQRRSTEGLSPILFICAFLGNSTYAGSLFLYSVSWQFILSRLPWIIGSAGVLVMDLLILLQFLFFNVILKRKIEGGAEEGFEKLEEEETSEQ
ncbi:predicted protein [Naegleria gruberi]|uniref:Predicted protein n=1 Tax=Naegleria gruberi TaxID=5762 RepID=D2V6N6_NAEGR|nr:uncharacterized protein NAEGRDRAFT_64505 [Naegleria gruberi]EFC47473.1 predicted protein [Naegleria gruberi]|eukprot:XP_002680217.1 predicted protein [Naegleria gruberi strain NEG-M]